MDIIKKIPSKFVVLLEQMLTKDRFHHSVAVATTARILATQYGEDIERATLAGFLHDVTKDTILEIQLQILSKSAIILNDIELASPAIWHAVSGYAFLKQEFPCLDESLLNAVRYHTTARAGMSLIEKIIFIADATSQDRMFQGVEALRMLAKKDIDTAILQCIADTIRKIVKQNRPVHIDTICAYNALVNN